MAGLGFLFPCALVVTCMPAFLVCFCIGPAPLKRSVRSRVTGTDATVADGRVPREDKEGNDAADVAADF